MSKGALATYPLLGAVTCQNVYFFPIVAISIIFSNLSPELLINFLPKLVNLRTLTERHVITFRKQLINLLYQPTWTILVKLGKIKMTPLIILNKIRKFYYRVKF
jgi:hypothetical protein